MEEARLAGLLVAAHAGEARMAGMAAAAAVTSTSSWAWTVA